MANWIDRFFGPKYVKPKGILLYGSVQAVIQTHKMLEEKGFEVRLVAPPPEFRIGCDLAVEFDLLEQEAVEATIKQQPVAQTYRIVSAKEMLPDILKRSTFVEIDGYIMCKAGNMKITVEKGSHKIVNISGGGCPDIPYVAEKLYGRKIEEADDPIRLGNSLCSYMLQISFDSLKREVNI
ncbi:MAG: DUF3343 domain-containing protein [Candidatus Omnitrophota bacterium]